MTHEKYFYHNFISLYKPANPYNSGLSGTFHHLFAKDRITVNGGRNPFVLPLTGSAGFAIHF